MRVVWYQGFRKSALQQAQVAGLCDALTDCGTQRQYRRGRDAEFIDADGQEGGQQIQIRAQLAADADPDTGGVGGVGSHLQRPKHSGMMGIIELAQIVGLTVASQGVLGQVVGAHGEEVHQLCQLRRHQHGGGGLDHDTQLSVGVVGNTFRGQLLHHALAGTLALLNLPDRGNHGEHNGDLAIDGSPVQGAKLGAEHLGAVQADTDGANAQSGVLLLLHIEV